MSAAFHVVKAKVCWSRSGEGLAVTLMPKFFLRDRILHGRLMLSL